MKPVATAQTRSGLMADTPPVRLRVRKDRAVPALSVSDTAYYGALTSGDASSADFVRKLITTRRSTSKTASAA